MTLFPLYIDPGIGSMLFSVIIGLLATVFFAFQAIFINVKRLFKGGMVKTDAKSGAKNKYVIYAEDKRYYTLFKPIIEEFESHKIELLYLTSSKDDPVFDADYKYIKTEFIGEGNRAFARLNFLSADFVLATTPALDVYQWKRSKRVKHYSHIFHATTDATTYRLFGLDYFDSILLTGEYQGNDIRILEKMRGLPEKQLVTVGCSYLDEYAKKIKLLPAKDTSVFTVLVSPSWGASALLSLYGEKLLDPLASSNFKIIIRPHPQSKTSEKEMLEYIQNRYKEHKNIEWDFERENISSLSKADIMISDFSGIIFDYMFLCDKPVLYVNHDYDRRPYDADDIDHELWQFISIKKAGIELEEKDFPKIVQIINNAKGSESLSIARKNARETAWQYPGEAGKRTFNFMIETVRRHND